MSAVAQPEEDLRRYGRRLVKSVLRQRHNSIGVLAIIQFCMNHMPMTVKKSK